MGDASEVDPAKMEGDSARVLTTGERIGKAYQSIRDPFVFTNKRPILVGGQGLTGSKVEYRPLPYRSNTHFSVEIAGHFGLDAESKVWISGDPMHIRKRFGEQLNIYDVQSVLAGRVLA